MRTQLFAALIGLFLALPAATTPAHGSGCAAVSSYSSYSYAAPAVASYASYAAPQYLAVVPTVLVPASVYTVGAAYLPSGAAAAVQPGVQAAVTQQTPAGSDKLDLILQHLQASNSRLDQFEQRIAAMEIKLGYGQQAPRAPANYGRPEAAPAPQRMPEEKRTPAAAKCAACHLPSNSGQLGGGYNLFDDKNQALPLNAEQQELVRAKVISGKMPPKNSGHDMTEAERLEVLDFFRIPRK